MVRRENVTLAFSLSSFPRQEPEGEPKEELNINCKGIKRSFFFNSLVPHNSEITVKNVYNCQKYMIYQQPVTLYHTNLWVVVLPVAGLHFLRLARRREAEWSNSTEHRHKEKRGFSSHCYNMNMIIWHDWFLSNCGQDCVALVQMNTIVQL